MTFDPEQFIPAASDWFIPAGRYEGDGCAEFPAPRGRLRGQASVTFDQSGQVGAEMTGQVEPETPLGHGLAEFLRGGTNWCASFAVETGYGIFISDSFSQEVAFDPFAPDAAGAKLRLEFLRSEFRASNAASPRYWVLPLLNFVTKFMPSSPSDLDRHPLRTHAVQAIPEDLSGEQKRIALTYVHSRSHPIVFLSDDRVGFIEALSDYHEREKRLLGGDACRAITAVMVGEILEHEAADWLGNPRLVLPFNLLGLLEVASGCAVGVPWVEIRGKDGQLIRRIHDPLRSPHFGEGHVAVKEYPGCGLSRLLTCALRSPEFSKPWLDVVLGYVALGGSKENTLEDRLRYLFLALDLLCEVSGVQGRNLLTRLPRPVRQRVEARLKAASDEIVAVPADHEDVEAIRALARKVTAPNTYTEGFRPGLERLLNHFCLPDAELMEKHYTASKRGSWLQSISKYRGTVMHRGYFDFVAGEETPRDVSTVTQHLLDILLRIVLKIACYDGLYQPAVASRQVDGRLIRKEARPVDWVTENTAAHELGCC